MAGIRERLHRERERRPWLDHLARAGSLYKREHGDHMAAAVTYFSLLALFPLIMLLVSVAGFVLSGRPDLFDDLHRAINDNIPGGLGNTVRDAVDSAVAHRGTVGVIGLLGVLYAGLGWIGNLRTAIQAIWAYEAADENFVVAKARDLLALAGLGVAALVSIGLTAGGTAATHQVVGWLGLANVTGVGTLTRVIGIGIAVLADTLVFGWLLVRLPRSPLTMRAVFRGSVFAAVGFEALKIVGSFYIAQVTRGPTAGIFGGVIGLLVWINLAARFVLFATAWTASAPSIRALHDRLADAARPGSEQGRTGEGEHAAGGKREAGERRG